MKHSIKNWFWLKRNKYRIYNKWLSVGVTQKFAFDKAKNEIPYFDNEKDEKIWIRQQKFKRILKKK